MTPAQFKLARHTAGLTQDQLAALLGVTPQTIRLWERKGPHKLAQAAIWAILHGWKE